MGDTTFPRYQVWLSLYKFFVSGMSLSPLNTTSLWHCSLLLSQLLFWCCDKTYRPRKLTKGGLTLGLTVPEGRTPSPSLQGAWARKAWRSTCELLSWSTNRKQWELSQNSLNPLKTQNQPPVTYFPQQGHTFPIIYHLETKYSNVWGIWWALP